LFRFQCLWARSRLLWVYSFFCGASFYRLHKLESISITLLGTVLFLTSMTILDQKQSVFCKT